MQSLFCRQSGAVDSLKEAEKLFYESVKQSHILYYKLFDLSIELKKFAERKIEIAKNKKIPSEEDLNPNLKFVKNRIVEQIAMSEGFKEYKKKYKISWEEKEDEILPKLYKLLINHENYKAYMKDELDSYELDKRFLNKFYTKILPYCEELYPILEEESVLWNDESEFVMSMIAKTIKKFTQTEGTYIRFLSQFSSSEDEDFAILILIESILKKLESNELIQKFSKSWDIDRISKLDNILLSMAIAEITNCQNVPLQVSMNEYIEIAKHYSTEKSGNFINGMLEKIKGEINLEGKAEYFKKKVEK